MGKIQVATYSNTVKKYYNRKKESNDVYGKKSHIKSECKQSVGEVLISNTELV